MTAEEFKATRSEQWSGALLALWWDGQGDWDHAHEVAQGLDDREGAWVPAYLHRKEGDEGNAGYWYRRAGRRAASGDSNQEWQQMVEEMLAR